MLRSFTFTRVLSFVALAAALLLTACTTEAQKYAASHPDLSSEHLAILKSGKIPDGIAVAGMTKAQVRLAMGKSPTEFSNINGVEAWVYAAENDNADLAIRNAELTPIEGRPGSTGAPNEENQSTIPHKKVTSKTIIFFQGDRAIRAEVTRQTTIEP
jgi:outer membrane protein assembly factor BamE (lipoprotein component of BamABCDE complex)